MRTILALLVVVAIAAPAFAGGNPNATAYLTFDPMGEVNRYDPPAPFTEASVYICLKHIDAGFISTTFAIVEDAGVTTGLGWSSLLPGGLYIGEWDVGTTVTSSECVMGPIVVVGEGTAFFMGNPGEIKIVDHPDYPRWVVDCNDEIDPYCLESNAGVLMDPAPTGEDCSVSPVEDATWGGIKALYR